MLGTICNPLPIRQESAPYAAHHGRNRSRQISQPDDPLLNQPNKITQADFANWVQERGLYFWSEFDPKYTPLLAMHDPGESDLNGGLVYAATAKVYTSTPAWRFFRELPEGVPGAYRLFVNLLSASKTVSSVK